MDGSTVTPLLRLPGKVSTAIWALEDGEVSEAVSLTTLEEIWYVLEGSGELWFRHGNNEDTIELSPGVALTVPLQTIFQFRSSRNQPLRIFGVSVPPYPIGSQDEVQIHRAGRWTPTRRK